ncbi:unnamed protein product [Rhizoctonia solani]|uniref:BTB domain-containing protein n=1 Tax=Rhizoctonia solani TaxID=456999 RepID=A0A8H3DMS2_9AGAM|nr:unnamed protein product [Rhizoctonia solani]
MPEDREIKYKVSLRGSRFILTKSQIEFDSPNYFTTCFLGDFTEAQTRVLELPRNPDLFPIITDYLCGYTVLPLSPEHTSTLSTLAISEARAIANLRADAEFYQLDGLIQACDEALELLSAKKVGRYVVLGSYYSDSGKEDLARRLVSCAPIEKFEIRVDKAKYDRDIVGTLTMRDKCKGYSDLRLAAAVERHATIRMSVISYHREEWRLLGWEAKPLRNGCLHLLTVVESLKD